MGRPPTAASWTCTGSPGSGPRVLMGPCSTERTLRFFFLSELLCFARRVQSYTSVKQLILPNPARSLLWTTREVTGRLPDLPAGNLQTSVTTGLTVKFWETKGASGIWLGSEGETGLDQGMI